MGGSFGGHLGCHTPCISYICCLWHLQRPPPPTHPCLRHLLTPPTPHPLPTHLLCLGSLYLHCWMVTYTHKHLAYIGAKVLLLDGCLGKVPRAPIYLIGWSPMSPGCLAWVPRLPCWMVKCVKILQYIVMVKVDYGDQG